MGDRPLLALARARRERGPGISVGSRSSSSTAISAAAYPRPPRVHSPEWTRGSRPRRRPARRAPGVARRGARAGLHEPEAVALATATPDGRPSVRMVLVRGLDERGLRFFTNYESRKAASSPRTRVPRSSSTGGRPSAGRSGRGAGRAPLGGRVARVLPDARAREPARRVGLAAVRPLADRGELDARYATPRRALRRRRGRAAAAVLGRLPPRPEAVELWENRPNRLHDRARYERAGDVWSRVRLAP